MHHRKRSCLVKTLNVCTTDNILTEYILHFLATKYFRTSDRVLEEIQTPIITQSKGKAYI